MMYLATTTPASTDRPESEAQSTAHEKRAHAHAVPCCLFRGWARRSCSAILLLLIQLCLRPVSVRSGQTTYLELLFRFARTLVARMQRTRTQRALVAAGHDYAC